MRPFPTPAPAAGRRARPRTARIALVAVLVAVTLVPGTAAWAHGDDPRVVSTLRGLHPALPDAVLARVLNPDSEQLAVVNPTPTPLVVLAPDGADFLRVSAGGVQVNEAASFTDTSRYPPGADVAPPAPTDPDAPPRWVRVSTDVSWRWYDPRLHPEPAAPLSGPRSVLASWTVPLRYGSAVHEVRGTVDWIPTTADLHGFVDTPPAGLGGSVIPGVPPRLVLQSAADAVTVLGAAGEPFLRSAPDGGWEASLDSPTYHASLIAEGRSVPAGAGWHRYSGPGPVNWTDERILPAPEALPTTAQDTTAAPWTWTIPVLVDGRRVELTGATRAAAVITPAEPDSLRRLPLVLLAAAVLVIAATAAVTVRARARIDRSPGWSLGRGRMRR